MVASQALALTLISMQSSKPFNLTAKRLEALRYLADHPRGVYVSGLAEAILTSQWRREHQSGFTAQQATRSGAGYALPLIKAGLVSKRDTDYGWGVVSITDAGLSAITRAEKSGAGATTTAPGNQLLELNANDVEASQP